MTYQEFLETKIVIAEDSGLDIDVTEINAALYPFQRDIVRWALKGGRRAIFASFGLGKSSMQIEFCHQVINKIGGKGMIVLPLGVRQEFKHDAVSLLGYPEPRYCTCMEEVTAVDGEEVIITNYERVRDGDIDPTFFSVTSLDEAAVLRSFGSKTYQEFLEKFRGVKYKLVATATPSPNKWKELIHYAGYLEIMDTGEALTRFFQRDSTKANNLTLYPAQEEAFWTWLSSWALFVGKPSDIDPTYSDEGYELPELTVNWHCLSEKYFQRQDKDGQLLLFQNSGAGLKEAAEIKRDSQDERIAFAKQIIDESPEDHFVIWHDLESERQKILKEIPGTVDIYGAMDYEKREQRVMDFSYGKTRLFATKKSLSGVGCNFQRYCHRAIFVGIDYAFHDFIQACHRIHRFLQKEPVVIDIIYMESEQAVKDALQEKWKNHNKMVATMTEIIRKYGLTDKRRFERLRKKMGVDRLEVSGECYKAVNADCVQETRAMPDNCIDLIHTSIPFGNHYEYSPNYADFGNNEDDESFFEQMDYLTPELLRVLKPGRVAAIHVKDRVMFGNSTGEGFPTIEPFHMMTTENFMKHGFRYMGMITVVTDVVRENNQTYRLGWTEQCKDGSKMGVGCPEYILLFRKPPTDKSTAYADVPVVKTKTEYTRAQWQLDAHAYWRSSGDRLVSKDELLDVVDHKVLGRVYKKYSRESVYNYDEHVRLCEELDEMGKLPSVYMIVPPASWNQAEVWDDIVRMRTLNTEQSRRRQQMHVCPLQLDVVERIINRFSNKGELVYDPFGGLGTVPMVAVKKGRKGLMCELNSDYFRDAIGYLETAEQEILSPTLFDLVAES